MTSEVAGTACPSCGRTTAEGDAFCEYCGAELAPAVVSDASPGFVPSCPVCSADRSIPQPTGVTADGYCESCGRKVPTGRDHVELDLGLLAGATDRGLRHPRNEDAMALATADTQGGPVAVAVVCDGVSSSPRPDEASLTAAQAAIRVLLDGVRMGDDIAEASRDAVQEAATALNALSGRAGAPSTTFVSAVVESRAAGPAETAPMTITTAPGSAPTVGDDAAGPAAPGTVVVASGSPDSAVSGSNGAVPDSGDGASGSDSASCGVITICWLGDSRAYWLAAGGSQRLTADDSLAQEMVDSGLLGEAEALASPQAHVITRWLGADIAEPRPHVTRFVPPGPGVLLVCSDGLWNYLPEAEDIAALAMPGALTDPAGAAGTLLKFALDAGGMDNITVVLVPVPLTLSRSSP
ncbi:MAG TPA: PP2C family serine/threonine-protein phosphatase [Streptosporangiaceae bacterium]